MDSNSSPTEVPYVDDQPSYSDVPPTGQGKRKLVIIIAIVVVALIVAGGAAYWLLTRPTSAPATTAQTQTSTSTSTQPIVPDDTQAQGTSANYVSNGKDLNLSFTYPSGWTVTPPSNSNPNDQAITVTSPLVSMTNASGQSTTGKVVVTIRPGGSALNELASNKSTAGQASAQIAYSKPTSAQHQYPYLTYIHLAGGVDPSSSFEEVMITGSINFAKDQVVSADALGPLDPVVSARFYTCSDQTCAIGSATPLSITNATWINTDVFMQTLAIFQSLQIN